MAFKIVIFFCQNLGYKKSEMFQALDLPGEFGVRLTPIPCSAEVTVGLLLKTFEADVDAIFVLGCPENLCQSGEGSIRAEKRVKHMQKILDELDIGKERLAMFEVNGAKELKQIAIDMKKRCLNII